MVRQRAMTSTVAALVALGSVAVVSGTAAAASRFEKAPKPCDLLTTSEVSQTLGRDVNAGKPRRSPVHPKEKSVKVSRCEWVTTDTTNPIKLEVDVFSGKGASKFYAGNKKFAQQREPEGLAVVADAGKDGFYYSGYNGATVLISDTRVVYAGLADDSSIPLEADLTTYWQDVSIAAAQLAAPRALQA